MHHLLSTLISAHTNSRTHHTARKLGHTQFVATTSSSSTLTKHTTTLYHRQPFPPTSHTRQSVNMGRLHSNGKGISASAIPYSRSIPTWFKLTPDQVVDNICKLAKKGATPSQIGVVLRDSHGVAQVKVVTGKSEGSEEKRLW